MSANAPGLTETINFTWISTHVVDEQVMFSEGGRLDAVIAPDWPSDAAPLVISVSGCYSNCGERDCRE